MQIAVHTFFQNCAALCMPPQRVREACHLLLERPGENMIPQETLEQTFKEIEKAPTAEALEQLLCLILQERMGLSKIALSKFKKEVQAVIIYVNAHYMDKLTLDGIADYVGLNREYLSRLFSKETGTGRGSGTEYGRFNRCKASDIDRTVQRKNRNRMAWI